MRCIASCLLAILIGISPVWASPSDYELIEATKAGDIASVKRLIEQGASPSAADGSEHSALMFAAEEGNLEIVKLLVQMGANVDAQDRDGETALMKACHGHHKAVDRYLLLEAKADCQLRNKDGLTAMDILMGVTADMVGERGVTAAQLEDKAPSANVSFRLQAMTIGTDTLKQHKELWVAADQSRNDNCRGFSKLLATAIAQGKAIRLKEGTMVSLTGKATGIVSQVTTQGIMWWIPNKALKAANVPVPAADYCRWLSQEEAANR